MANIQTLLAKIMSAIYGEEVRGSIHDAIEAMNEEVEDIKAIDVTVDHNEIVDARTDDDGTTHASLGDSVRSVGSRSKSVFKSRFNGKKLSIIGDSIDTFNQTGYKIDGYRMYYPALGVTDVNQTWWKRVMDNSGMTMEVNASWSGSRVTNTSSDQTYPDFYDRVSVIGSPDVIFVTLGTNDSSGSVALGDYDFITEYTNLSESTFRTAYIKGVKALKTLYPSADIVCISEKMQESYRESIEYIANELSVEYIDVSDYIGASGVHPGVAGMDQIASLVLYPTDSGLWQKHYPADAKKVGTEIDSIKSALIPSSEKDLTIVIGTLDNGQDATLNTRCKTLDYIPVSADDYVVFDDSSYQLSVTEYNENKQFVSVSGWMASNRYKVVSGAYIRAVIRRNDNAVISDEDIATVKENLYIFNVSTIIKNINASVNEISESISDISFQNKVRNALLVGWQHSGTGTYYYHEPPTRNTITTPIYTDYKVVLSTDAEHQFAVQFYDGYETGEDHLLSATQWIKEYTIQPGEYFCITLRNADNSRTSEETNNYLSVQSSKPINLSVSDNSEALDLINNKTNYSVSESLKTRGVNLEIMGVLTYLQAFCKYNNSYYSTNGEHISVQDSTFTETNNVAINLGHGNSMQIGTLHKNYAYVSGWNDQKVYAVNLDTLEIVDTITLPTTGYTTVAIDDINGIAYIFQRASYPSTEESYNFIVYDYVNNEIISTKKTYRPFAAMQAVEFYEGKIYVLNGLGTVEAPNYYLIYNTNGDIIGEYILSDFANTEPEGIYIDRKTREIYLSLVNKTVYKMS